MYPICFEFGQLHESVEHDGDVKLRHTKPFRASVHSDEVVAGTEHSDFAFGILIGFQTFENSLSVVERTARGIEREIVERHDFGLRQTDCGVILHSEHIVGKKLAEHVFAEIGIMLSGFHGGDFNYRLLNAERDSCVLIILLPRAERGKRFLVLTERF